MYHLWVGRCFDVIFFQGIASINSIIIQSDIWTRFYHHKRNSFTYVHETSNYNSELIKTKSETDF